MTVSRVARLVSCVVGAIALASCVEVEPRPGTATYYVTLEDPVVDSFGVTQSALCVGFVTFTGEIDASCILEPMIWSDAQVAPLECAYRDAQSTYHYYTDDHFFEAGYIHEADCEEGE